MDGHTELIEYCKSVLKQNDLGGWTRPAAHLYPHQWLWDSCFTAIGIRHYDTKRAQKEVTNLFRGQWKNGMIPNTILSNTDGSGKSLWHSEVSKSSPKHVSTSGITQPPMVAEAIVRIGEKLTKKERLLWYKALFPKLVAYHEWLYRERDPHSEGIVILIHPWESGLDNTPSWMQELYLNEMPLWIKAVKKLHLHSAFNLIRSDTKFLPAYQRIDVIDALSLYSIARQLRRKKYETRLILRHGNFAIEDLGFNSILIRANTLLQQIATEINQELPQWLTQRFALAHKSLELLWSETDGQYFSRNFETFELIEQPSIMTFLPLYAGTVSKKRAEELVVLLRSKDWWMPYPVPSVPKNSHYFDASRYWQGPTWLNTNWLIADGLIRYGYIAEAEAIKQRSVELVTKHGSYEYFSPIDGIPSGANSFSWTAALTIDMLSS
ncbi:glycoside hydrolase [Candidatus Saccharibacteria bacterium]|nr:glycoside hydrolase [Candidatus Saccharibacteria bacterium]